jgi:hypothetical protein
MNNCSIDELTSYFDDVRDFTNLVAIDDSITVGSLIVLKPTYWWFLLDPIDLKPLHATKRRSGACTKILLVLAEQVENMLDVAYVGDEGTVKFKTNIGKSAFIHVK